MTPVVVSTLSSVTTAVSDTRSINCPARPRSDSGNLSAEAPTGVAFSHILPGYMVLPMMPGQTKRHSLEEVAPLTCHFPVPQKLSEKSQNQGKIYEKVCCCCLLGGQNLTCAEYKSPRSRIQLALLGRRLCYVILGARMAGWLAVWLSVGWLVRGWNLK